MRIALSAGLIQDNVRGGDVYFRNLAAALSRIDGENEYFLFGYVFRQHPRRTAAIPCPEHPNFRRLIKRWPQGLVLRAEKDWGLPVVESYLRTQQIELYHEPGPMLPNLRVIPALATFHDLIPFSRPELVEGSTLQRWQASGRDAAERARLILASSTATKNDLMEHLKVPAEKIRVAILGVDRETYRPLHDREALAAVRRRLGLPERFLLSVGPYEKRRNWEGLLRAAAALETDRPYGVVLTGGIPAAARAGLLRLAGELGLEARVVLTGYLPDADLPAIYNLAAAFVYPSFYDGFNLPLIEAMACGAPVVVSAEGALPEIAGDAAVFVDPHDRDSIVDGVKRALAAAPELREKGRRRAAELTWERTAQATLRAYREAAAYPKPPVSHSF